MLTHRNAKTLQCNSALSQDLEISGNIPWLKCNLSIGTNFEFHLLWPICRRFELFTFLSMDFTVTCKQKDKKKKKKVSR